LVSPGSIIICGGSRAAYRGGKDVRLASRRRGWAGGDFGGFPVRGAGKGQKGHKRAFLGEMGRFKGFWRVSGSFSDSLLTKKSQRTPSESQRTVSERQRATPDSQRTTPDSQRPTPERQGTTPERQMTIPKSQERRSIVKGRRPRVKERRPRGKGRRPMVKSGVR